MNNGKFSRRKPAKRGYKRITGILLALVLLITAGVVGTIAYIQTSTPDVANTFTPGYVPPVINETKPSESNNWTKSNVTVTNNGNVAAYIRVAVAATWRDKDGNIAPFSVATGDYTVTPATPANGWVKHTDGYYYYTEPVAPGKPTPVLFEKVTYTAKEGYELHFQIAASTIQADGVDAKGNKPVALAWGVNIADGAVTKANIIE